MKLINKSFMQLANANAEATLQHPLLIQ